MIRSATADRDQASQMALASAEAGTRSPIPRLARLRQALLDAPYGLCTAKAELLTEYFRRHHDGDALVRNVMAAHFVAARRALARNLGRGAPQADWQLRLSNELQRFYLKRCGDEVDGLPVAFAQALAHVLEHVPLRIYPDELIVGNLSSRRVGAPIHPDFGGLLLLPELDRLADRPVNPLITDPEQIRRLKEDVFPFWFGRSVLARTPLLAADPALQNTLVRGRELVLTQFAGISHVTPDYPEVLERGFHGILGDVLDARRQTADPDARRFLLAAEIAARAAIAFGARWSAHCAADAMREPDPARAEELRALAGIFAQVPGRRARTFHEALQSVFLTHVIVHQESFQHGVSFGRVDQYLYPYFRADVAEGRLSRERAVELVGCFLAKAAEQLPLFNAMATEYFSGLSSASGLTLGGTDGEGGDAANELTLVFLDAYDRMRLRQPNLHLRLHPGTPEAVRRRAYEILKKGGGMPALFNDDAIVPAIRALGVAERDARDYAIVGCVEWGVPRKSFPAAGAGFLSLPAALDDALHDLVAAGEGEPAAMEDVAAAFERRLADVVTTAVAGNDAIERAHARFRPTPLLSLLVDGCIDSGRDVTAGGAHYDSTGLQGVGLADVADSLAAIEQVVFRERRCTLAELVAALDVDFDGHDLLRARLLNKAPKYGCGDATAEAWAARLARTYAGLVRAHRNPRGGPYAPGFWSMTTHVGLGKRLGALPSGRRAGMPLADGISPANGSDSRGPTASLLAAARVCGAHVGNGLALNEKLSPGLAEGEAGSDLIDGLTRGYFAAGGQQVQYNVVDARVLIDAKKHPERYRDLVVRISGYSAYFNDLTEEMKDDVIARTLHDSDRPGCQLPAARRRR